MHEDCEYCHTSRHPLLTCGEAATSRGRAEAIKERDEARQELQAARTNAVELGESLMYVTEQRNRFIDRIAALENHAEDLEKRMKVADNAYAYATAESTRFQAKLRETEAALASANSDKKWLRSTRDDADRSNKELRQEVYELKQELAERKVVFEVWDEGLGSRDERITFLEKQRDELQASLTREVTLRRAAQRTKCRHCNCWPELTCCDCGAA